MKNKKKIDLSTLEKGTKVDYVFFKDVEYVGHDEVHVTLKDNSGTEKEIYINLFLKYAQLTEATKEHIRKRTM